MKKKMILRYLLVLAGVYTFCSVDVQAKNPKPEVTDTIVLLSEVDGGSVPVEKELWEQSKTIAELHEIGDYFKTDPNKLTFSTFDERQLKIARLLMSLALELKRLRNPLGMVGVAALRSKIDLNNLDKEINDEAKMFKLYEELFEIADFFEIAMIPELIAHFLSSFLEKLNQEIRSKMIRNIKNNDLLNLLENKKSYREDA